MNSKQRKTRNSTKGKRISEKGFPLSIIKTVFKIYLVLMTIIGLVIVFAPTRELPDYSASSIRFDVDSLAYDFRVAFESNKFGYIKAGEKEKVIGSFKFFTGEDSIRFNSVIFHISGSGYNGIKDLFLIDKETGVRYVGKKDGSYVVFPKILKKVLASYSSSFDVVANFSTKLHAGDNIVLSIDNARDIDVTIRGEGADSDAQFPLNGNTMFVVGDIE